MASLIALNIRDVLNLVLGTSAAIAFWTLNTESRRTIRMPGKRPARKS
jgi:hypothetical protein